MERRRSQRRSASIEVLVYHEGLPITWAGTGDISQHGISITKNGAELQAGNVVEIEFPFSGPCHGEHYRCPATIVRADPWSLGLQFERQDPHVLHWFDRYQSAVNRDRLQITGRRLGDV